MEAADINLIEACKRGKPSAQREVYTRFQPYDVRRGAPVHER